MCGITGWVDYGRDLSAKTGVLRAITATMACRGPDAEGVWLGRHAAIGHRRLAVIDLEGGAQPMVGERSEVVLSFSGEIYNFRELRHELAGHGHEFRTRSDTEMLLHAYLQTSRPARSSPIRTRSPRQAGSGTRRSPVDPLQ